MVLQYEKCDESNLEQLLEISKKTFSDAFETDNDPNDFKTYLNVAFTKEILNSAINNPNIAFFFTYLGEKLVAYFKLNTSEAQTDVKLSESMELERIYVLKEFQGRGIGEAILTKIKKIAFESEKAFLWLGVWEENQRAIKFYQRHGFSKFGTHPYFIGTDKQTDWLMRYDLVNFIPK
ncbi:GNAT family N-acetyltransferase [Maribacter sp. 2210JD10-5]|uniref:GNAT family N-acetyltransferase n=1 Tax=Maribacter sp. 2210JD10-5 TaxID=3386272 RepID=UPI0039BCCE84